MIIHQTKLFHMYFIDDRGNLKHYFTAKNLSQLTHLH